MHYYSVGSINLVLHLWTFKTPILNVLKLLFLLIIVINNYGGGILYVVTDPMFFKNTFSFFINSCFLSIYIFFNCS